MKGTEEKKDPCEVKQVSQAEKERGKKNKARERGNERVAQIRGNQCACASSAELDPRIPKETHTAGPV